MDDPDAVALEAASGLLGMNRLRSELTVSVTEASSRITEYTRPRLLIVT